MGVQKHTDGVNSNVLYELKGYVGNLDIGFTEQYKGHKTKLTIYSTELEETFYEININNLFSRKNGNGKISDEK